jgi:hypothetical protein
MSCTARGNCGGSVTVDSYPIKRNDASAAAAKKCYTISVRSYSGDAASIQLSEKEFRQLIAEMCTK